MLKCSVARASAGARVLTVIPAVIMARMYPRVSDAARANMGIPVKGIGSAQARCYAQIRRHPAVAALIDTEAGEPTHHSPTEAWADLADFRRQRLA